MIAKHKFWRVLTRIHKWAGLVIGLQIVLWFASGFFMSFFSIDKVHGDHMATKHVAPIMTEHVISLEQALALYPSNADQKIHGIHLRSALGAPVWEINGSAGVVQIDALRGTIWQGIDEASIRGAAQSYYIGEGQIKTVLNLDVAPKDYRKGVPIWQVIYDDRAKTRLYISPDTGALINVRTRLWRVFDFMWMLHIMDYKDRDNINLWWLKLISFCALLFALSGVGLVIHRVFLRPKRKQQRLDLKS